MTCNHPDVIICPECAMYPGMGRIQTDDMVNHPNHYANYDVECIDVIEMIPHLKDNYHLGCAFKYLWRAGVKDESAFEQDIQKAIWYLQRFLEKENGHG